MVCHQLEQRFAVHARSFQACSPIHNGQHLVHVLFMLRIIDCLTVDHDIGLMLLASAICVLGFSSSAAVVDRTKAGQASLIWRLLLSLCIGATAWSTHFIGMLSYETSIPMLYEPSYTVASLVLAISLTYFGVSISLSNHDQRRQAIGGAVVGLAVVALHYVGMEGLEFPGLLRYDLDLVVISIALALLFGGAALPVLLRERNHSNRVLGTSLLILMTVSLHFIGMSAVQLELGAIDMPSGGVSRFSLAVAVTVMSLLVLTIGLVVSVVDQRLDRQRAAEAERFRTLSDGAFEGLIVHDQQTILDANIAARNLLSNGWPLTGETLHIRPPDGAIESTLDPESLEEALVSRLDGSEFPAEISRRVIRTDSGGVAELVAIRDITARKAADEKMIRLAMRDALTDLPNRRLFNQIAADTIYSADQSKTSFALLTLDIDHFKMINDVHGHSVGDELIVEVAKRLESILRKTEMAARLGGDEFALLQSYISRPEQVSAFAERVQEAMVAPFKLEQTVVNASVSIGIAMYPSDGATVEGLMQNADIALYQAKADGRATSRFFQSDMNQNIQRRRMLEDAMRIALNTDGFSMAFQPLVSINEHKPVSFEALLRWHDNKLGHVPPDQFIPVAESSGLIRSLGEFALRKACEEAVNWPENIRVAVNLSPAQFKQPGLVDMVRRTLASTGLPGSRLELEITESLFIDNRADAVTQLNQFRTMGITVAMDDFGTGYSSLSYLHSFDFDKIKIDRSFICDIESNQQNESIVKAVISIGRSFGMEVVAEGVETTGQAELLRQLDCDLLQGYLIAKPMTPEQLHEYLAAQSLSASPIANPATPKPATQ